MTGTTTGVFVKAKPTQSPIEVHGVGSNNFTWGTPTYISGNHGPISEPNRLRWDAASPLVGVNTETEFLLGKLTYFNGTVLTGTTPDFVSLKIGLSLSAPDVINQNFEFKMGLNTTPNTHTNPNLNADYVYFPSNFPNTTITIGGTVYTLEIVGFRDFGGQNALQSDAKQFHVLEQGRAWANLYGKITANFPPDVSPAPEPASIISAATAGLIGLAYAARRRRKGGRA